MMKERRISAPPLLEVLRTLRLSQWGLLFSGWLAWICASIDFYSLSSSPRENFENISPIVLLNNVDIITQIFRLLGSIFFGVISDRLGRKYPLIMCLFLISIFELTSGFVQTFSKLKSVRFLFGFCMGGIWGNASATVLENIPVELRGLASGFFQQGYAIAYIATEVVRLFLASQPTPNSEWSSFFWIAGGISFFAMGLRVVLPESQVFMKARMMRDVEGETTSLQRTRTFVQELKEMLKKRGGLWIYGIVFTASFQVLLRRSEHLYPIHMLFVKNMICQNVSVLVIIGSCGGVIGSIFAGWLSQAIGRRLTISLYILLIGAFIPVWVLSTSFTPLTIGVFLTKFCIQGALGVVPIQLAEISPPSFRATFPGVVYEVGIAIALLAEPIELAVLNHPQNEPITGDHLLMAQCFLVQCVMIGTAAILILFITSVGPEKRGAHFEVNKVAYTEGSSKEQPIFDIAARNSMQENNEIPHDALVIEPFRLENPTTYDQPRLTRTSSAIFREKDVARRAFVAPIATAAALTHAQCFPSSSSNSNSSPSPMEPSNDLSETESTFDILQPATHVGEAHSAKVERIQRRRHPSLMAPNANSVPRQMEFVQPIPSGGDTLGQGEDVQLNSRLSRYIRHSDSGTRFLSEGEEIGIVELPPDYTVQ